MGYFGGGLFCISFGGTAMEDEDSIIVCCISWNHARMRIGIRFGALCLEDGETKKRRFGVCMSKENDIGL